MGGKLVRINDIPAELHREARVMAAVAGITLKEWIILALEEKILRDQQR